MLMGIQYLNTQAYGTHMLNIIVDAHNITVNAHIIVDAHNYALVGGAPRHTVVVVFVRLSICLSVCVLFCSALFSVTATN